MGGRLYENYPNEQEDFLLSMMQKLKSTGSPWEEIFAEAVSAQLFDKSEPLIIMISYTRIELPEDRH